MNDPSSHRCEELEADQVAVVNDFCDRFEQAWSQGCPPAIETHLADAPEPIRQVLLHELILVDASYRLGKSLGFEPLDYQRRFPELDSQWLAEKVALSASTPVPDGIAHDSTPPSLPNYDVIGEIGRGGMGIAYQARDRRLGRFVCLKSLTAEARSHPERLARFRREATVISSLNHPNICTIHDLAEHDDKPYLVLEWIEGETLRALIRREVAAAALISVMRQVARALAAAHASDIVHRDIKPENIMVRPDGLAKVLDFGLARLLIPDGMLDADNFVDTGEGMLLGTVKYMAPEQARGELVTSATDVFSLGVVFYELATGRHPFPGESLPTILHGIASIDPQPAVEVNPNLDLRINDLIMRMLGKLPASRPSAEEIAEALSAVPDGAAAAHWPTAPAPYRKHDVVGRREEQHELATVCHAASRGQGSFVCISGEPGIGKTTLVEEFLREAVDRFGCFAMRGRCSQRLSLANAYLSILDALEDLAEGPARGVAFPLLKSTAPAWYALVASSDAASALEAAAQQLSPGRLNREFRSFLEALTLKRPVILVVDDVHWSDESTVDLLSYLGQEIHAMRVVVLATYRPTELSLANHPFDPLRLELQSRGRCRELALRGLSEGEISKYLALHFPNHALPPTLASALYKRTEGNPLFLVSLLSFLQDQAVLVERDGAWQVVQAIPDLGRDLPDSITSLIERKLGYLPSDDRQLLQIASVQGNEFDAAVVADVAGVDRAETEERLQALARVHGLILERREVEFPDGTLTIRCQFVHVLYQNALYTAVAPARRSGWSLAIAQALESHHGAKAKNIAIDLAFLYEAARDPARAIPWFVLSAQQAVTQATWREAIELCRHGLRLVPKLEQSEQRDRMELELQYSLGFAESLSSGYSSQQSLSAYRRVEELCSRLPPGEELFTVLHLIYTFHFFRIDAPAHQAIGMRLIELADELRIARLQVAAYANCGVSHLLMGDLSTAARQFDHAWSVADYGPQDDMEFIRRMCAPVGLICRGICVWLWWILGRFDDSTALEQLTLEQGEQLQIPQFRIQPWSAAGFLYYLRREPRPALDWANKSLAYAEQHDLPLYVALAIVVKAWAEVMLSVGDESQRTVAVETARQVIEMQSSRGIRPLLPVRLCMIGESLCRMKRHDEARQYFENALAVCCESGDRWWEAEILRQLGELYGTAFDDQERAVAYLQEAVDVTRRQGAMVLELRCLASLVRRLSPGDRRDEAVRELAKLLATFDEGRETRDLADAREVLATAG